MLKEARGRLEERLRSRELPQIQIVVPVILDG